MSVGDLFRRLPGGRIEASAWGRRYGDDLGQAWLECPRGDWSLFLAGILEVGPALVTLAACDCARFAVALLPDASQETHLLPVIEAAARWARGRGSVEACREAAKRVLAIYKERQEDPSEPPTAGYAAAAVSAAANVPTFRSPLGIASGAAAAALAAAQVATPTDENAILDAHRLCADLVRKRIPLEALVATPGFRAYARGVERQA